MGLFGLFGGNKESKEEKQFWKVFKAAFSSHKEKNLLELLEAVKAYPKGWQGYFLAGLYYEFGIGGLAVDEEKAVEFRLKAEAAAKGTEGENWLNHFYDWYEKDALNIYRKYDDITLKCRKLGVAAMHTYQYDDTVIYSKGDAEFWNSFFLALPSKYIVTTGGLYDLFYAWSNFSWQEDNDKIKNTSKLIDKANKSNALAAKNKLDHHDFTDMYMYILAYGAVHESPYMMDLAAEKSGESKVQYGITRLMSAADIGCAPAIHDLILLAHASEENYNTIDYYCKKYYDGDDLEIKEAEWTNSCMRAGSDEAFRLSEMYRNK